MIRPEPQAARLSHLCGLSIEDKVPDHSAFSHARNERFRDSDIFRIVFERVVGACIGAGLVGGEGFAVRDLRWMPV
jgi:transposase